MTRAPPLHDPARTPSSSLDDVSDNPIVQIFKTREDEATKFTPFRVKVHAENVSYEVRRISGRTIFSEQIKIDFLIARGEVMKVSGEWTFPGPNGWLPMSSNEMRKKFDLEKLQEVAIAGGDDVETIRTSIGQIIEYLDEPGLEGRRIVAPMPAGHYGLHPSDEVRCGDTYYVGYTEEQIKELEVI